MDNALRILCGIFKDQSVSANVASRQSTTCARLVLNGNGYAIKTEEDAQKCVSELGPKSVTSAALTLFYANESAEVVTIGAEMITSNDGIENSLRGQGLSQSAIDRIKKEQFGGDFAAGGSVTLFQLDGEKFIPVSLSAALECGFKDVVTVLCVQKGHQIVCSANQTLGDHYACSLLGDSGKIRVRIMDRSGGVYYKDFTPSSKSGFTVILRDGGGATLGAGLATLIAIFTALSFNLVAFFVALALIALGVGLLIAYEKLSDNPA
jgi:hypothetical protein